jgi:hypothetical protein
VGLLDGCAQDGREEGRGRCQFITVDSCLELTLITPHHYRFLARTGSDMSPSTYCWFQPQTNSDVNLHYRFSATPNHFLVLKHRTGSEGFSLLVSKNLALMSYSVVVRHSL